MESIPINKLSIQQIDNISIIKSILDKDNIDYQNDKYPNSFYIRFLKAYNNDTKKAANKIKEYFKFDTEYNIININNKNFPNIDKIKLFYPHNFHKTTKKGYPILLQSLGEIKIDMINKILPGNLLTQYEMSLLETLYNKIFPICSKISKKEINKLFCIVDVKGAGSDLMSKKILNFLKLQLNICEKCYPQVIDELFLINTNLLFRGVWNTCKYFYSEKIRKRTHFLGFDYKNRLLEHVDAVDLPILYGGNCNCQPYGCFFSEDNIWNKDISNNKSSMNESLISDEITSSNEIIYRGG